MKQCLAGKPDFLHPLSVDVSVDISGFAYCFCIYNKNRCGFIVDELLILYIRNRECDAFCTIITL